jgi:membrane protease YdiL (CAAX protease family)
MPAWGAFAGFVGLVLAGLLLLAVLSADAVDAPTPSSPSGPPASGDAPATLGDRVVGAPEADATRTGREPSAATLFLNVVLLQGLFASLLVVGAWYADVPAATLGLTRDAVAATPLAAGAGLGLALHAANTAGSRLSDRLGLGDSAALRRAMTPESPAGWAVLLLVVLPLVAGFEELLFRGILIGAFSAGFDVSPWLLAAGSSVLFALGHGAQGRVGVLVTGVFGFVLAAAFVLTGSLAAVVLAHYLVNALEFLAGGS